MSRSILYGMVLYRTVITKAEWGFRDPASTNLRIPHTLNPRKAGEMSVWVPGATQLPKIVAMFHPPRLQKKLVFQISSSQTSPTLFFSSSA